MPDRPYRVVARDRRSNAVQQVYRVGDRFTRNPNAKGRKALFSKKEAKAAVKWGEGKNLAVWVTKSPYPFLVLDTDTAWPRKELCNRLNQLCRRLKRYGWIGEGTRTARRQWELRMQYLQGRGNLAARCCTKHWGQHSWAACGKNPLSNHASGSAADMSIFRSGRSGDFVNVGNWGGARPVMRDLGLCLPVGCGVQPEPWHVEFGNRWCA